MNKDKYYKKMTEALKEVNVKCICGHSINITNRYKRKICRWCGRMVYLNEDDKKRNDSHAFGWRTGLQTRCPDCECGKACCCFWREISYHRFPAE